MIKHPSPRCVVKVGGGRGFVTERRVRLHRPKKGWRRFVEHRLVVTAAHCLPKLPPAHALAYSCDRTYKLLGSLDGQQSDIWAECLFVDPVSDIAVLGCPDGQELFDEAERYDSFVGGLPFLRIAKVRSGTGYMLNLAGRWARIRLEVHKGIFGTGLVIDPTEAGQSGSPILNDRGQAVGVVAIGSVIRNRITKVESDERCGPQPILTRNLPAWMLEL